MTAHPGKNPFRPGVGARPIYLAGRDEPMRRFQAMLRAAPEQAANMRLTGLRGVGKSVLLDEFATLAEKAGWVTGPIEILPSHNQDDTLVESIRRAAEGAKLKLSRAERVRKAIGQAARTARGLGIGWNDFVVTYQPFSDAGREDLGRDLFEVVEIALNKGRNGFILLLDEAQILRDERAPAGEHPLSLLVSSVVALQRREVPIGLVLCGLPTLTGNLLRARSYTERMFRAEDIGRLDPAAARDAFVKPLESDDAAIQAGPELVAQAIEEVERYPYFIQLWGSELWDAAVDAGTDNLTPELLVAARPEIYRRLDLESTNRELRRSPRRNKTYCSQRPKRRTRRSLCPTSTRR